MLFSLEGVADTKKKINFLIIALPTTAELLPAKSDNQLL